MTSSVVVFTTLAMHVVWEPRLADEANDALKSAFLEHPDRELEAVSSRVANLTLLGRALLRCDANGLLQVASQAVGDSPET